jgi:two-component system, OmpR family, alkaline phosphatase synthesis response regulator PhoP
MALRSRHELVSGLRVRHVGLAWPTKVVTAMTKTASVLIVDDEPNILLSLQFLMKKSGYDVRTAKDGEEALAEIARAAPDLVLLDVMMPKIDGFSICERIRANPEWKDMRIIMLTARGRDVEREKGLALGADDYITKPFSTKDAIARVEAALARSPKSDDR